VFSNITSSRVESSHVAMESPTQFRLGNGFALDPMEYEDHRVGGTLSSTCSMMQSNKTFILGAVEDKCDRQWRLVSVARVR
jgi:hypothetical protein